MKFKRTLKLVLKPTEEQKHILLETLEQYKFAYNYTCKIGWKAQTCKSLKSALPAIRYDKRSYIEKKFLLLLLKGDRNLKFKFLNILSNILLGR